LQLGEYEIAWVDAEAGKTENDMLSLLPVSGAPHPHKSVLVGDLKLADFKQFLSTKGVPVFCIYRFSTSLLILSFTDSLFLNGVISISFP